MPYTTLLLLICCATFYYRIGESEHRSGGLLALISIGLWGIGTFAFGFGSLANLLIQVGLFFVLTGWNVWRHGR